MYFSVAVTNSPDVYMSVMYLKSLVAPSTVDFEDYGFITCDVRWFFN